MRFSNGTGIILKKFSFSAIFLFCTALIFSEGLSIGTVKNNPYFPQGIPNASDSSENVQDVPAEDIKQMTDPDNTETFYNAENWPDGLRNFDEEDTEDEDTAESEKKLPEPEEKSSSKEQKNKKDELTEEDLELLKKMVEVPAPLETDGEKRKEGSFNANDVKFNVSAGYLVFYSPSMMKGSVQSYFDQFGGFNITGLFATAEYFLKNDSAIKPGIGISGSWSYLFRNTGGYDLTGNQYNLDFLFHAKWLRDSGDSLDIRAGFGMLFITDLHYLYKVNGTSGVSSEKTDWSYPEIRLGCSYEYYVYDHFGFRVGGDLVWPFKIEKIYPRLDIQSGIVVRF